MSDQKGKMHRRDRPIADMVLDFARDAAIMAVNNAERVCGINTHEGDICVHPDCTRYAYNKEREEHAGYNADAIIKSTEHNGEKTLKAKVDKNTCTGCGACETECPNNAIAVRDVAEIDEKLCDGCGKCVEMCPVEAITLQ